MALLGSSIALFRRRFWQRICVSTLVVLLIPLVGLAGDGEIKAAFLYNAARFVTWPAGALPKETITIGLLGNGSLTSGVKGLRDKTLHGRHIQIRQGTSLEELKGCRVLVILPSERRELSSLLLTLRKEPVLTVSEIEGFSQQGGMLAITVTDNHPAFKVNLRAVRTAGLEVSSQLLKLAELVIQ